LKKSIIIIDELHGSESECVNDQQITFV